MLNIIIFHINVIIGSLHTLIFCLSILEDSTLGGLNCDLTETRFI